MIVSYLRQAKKGLYQRSIVELRELLKFVAWSSSRKAISPVPPAMSSIFQPAELELVEEPGLRLRTKWSL